MNDIDRSNRRCAGDAGRSITAPDPGRAENIAVEIIRAHAQSYSSIIR
jgi:hypothetical protein